MTRLMVIGSNVRSTYCIISGSHWRLARYVFWYTVYTDNVWRCYKWFRGGSGRSWLDWWLSGLMSDLLTALSLVHTEDQLDMFSDIHCTQTLWGDVINGLEGSGRSWPDWWSLGLCLICLLHYLWFTKDQLHNMFFDIQCTQTILCGDDIFVLEEEYIDHDRIDGYPV